MLLYNAILHYTVQFHFFLGAYCNSKDLVMFKRRSGASSSLHAPRGMRIHELDKNPRMKRKLSWCNPKVRNAASEGVLTHKPVILKEGFLYKPGFFKLVR